MDSLNAALEQLGFDRATTDAQRTRLLHAIRTFARSVGDEALALAAERQMPAADPFNPPPNWLRGFADAFQEYADEEAGTDPDGGLLQGSMKWDMSPDAWRRERVRDSFDQGFEDGRIEAQAQNDV